MSFEMLLGGVLGWLVGLAIAHLIIRFRRKRQG